MNEWLWRRFCKFWWFCMKSFYFYLFFTFSCGLQVSLEEWYNFDTLHKKGGWWVLLFFFFFCAFSSLIIWDLECNCTGKGIYYFNHNNQNIYNLVGILAIYRLLWAFYLVGLSSLFWCLAPCEMYTLYWAAGLLTGAK